MPEGWEVVSVKKDLELEWIWEIIDRPVSLKLCKLVESIIKNIIIKERIELLIGELALFFKKVLPRYHSVIFWELSIDMWI